MASVVKGKDDDIRNNLWGNLAIGRDRVARHEGNDEIHTSMGKLVGLG